ncbi:hypothetical protein [Marinobacter sp. P4B1]|uniref:hypothetical protein n=1 Tax=Marinobacter sp. P4B1 TaxID=1119533 RepID=UPI00071E5D7F|nr:hypothetical protein [Marinobacter sp. P4B1]KRW82224.1 hypothetical protein AQ621_11465 [Marinobacter sp. P4B1]
MNNLDIGTYRLVQSVKRLGGQRRPGLDKGVTLADRLYLDAMSAAFSGRDTTPDDFVARMIAKTLAAARIGEIAKSDFERMSAADRENLANALCSMAPSTTHAALPRRPGNHLPILSPNILPEVIVDLVFRARAGYEGPDGVRHQGAWTESQAAHALATAVIAGLRAGTEAALLAFVHNAHLALMPDIPHLVEASMGSECLQQMEAAARGRLLADLGSEREGQFLFQSLKGPPSTEVTAAVDEADFIDRTLWLIEIAPPWLDLDDSNQLRRTLCNEDHRLERQLVLLDEIMRNTVAHTLEWSLPGRGDRDSE